ncbi:uncharacterized protein [Dysidea avara]|uniref:uncharacterized protein n=1 Tax=Dysidea avara TaxID=196820 RepID=UPI00332159CA
MAYIIMSVCFQLTLATGHNDISDSLELTSKIYHLQLTRIFMIQCTLCVFDFINFPRPHGCLNVTENIEFNQHPVSVLTYSDCASICKLILQVPQEISEQVGKNKMMNSSLHYQCCWSGRIVFTTLLATACDVPSAIQMITCHVTGSNSSEVAVKHRLLMMK